MKPSTLLLALLAAAALLAACGAAARPVLTNTGTASDSIPVKDSTFFARNNQASNAGAASDPECINCESVFLCPREDGNGPCVTASQAAQRFTPGAQKKLP